ncbi:hypothetical protein D3C86_1363200 [compost metagenome]
MLDQDKKENIRRDKSMSENSELTLDESKLLTWYRELSDTDRGYVRHIAQMLVTTRQ